MLSAYAALLVQLQLALGQLAEALQTDDSGIHPAGQPTAKASRQGNYPALRNQLQTMRALKPTLLQELGSLPERHPAVLLLASLDATASRLVTLVRAMERAAPSPEPAPQLERLHRAEADLLAAMANQLRQWERAIRSQSQRRASGSGLPLPPPERLRLPGSWLELNQELNNPAVNTAASERLERIAVRLQLCRQAERAIRDGESSWARIVG
jgi:hypothetical protein